MATLNAALPPANLTFPQGFLWGASTAGHQVEGGLTDNWTAWERANADRLASTAGKRLGDLPSWPAIKAEAIDPANYISGQADDDYGRYLEDLDAAQSLHLSAYRFSLEWSRIEPRPGQFDEAALDHYDEVIAATKARGMEPFVTMYHWTLPTWLADSGGWENPQADDYFAAYAQKVADRLGNQATFWITVNEPQVYAGNSYLTGSWTPQKRSLPAYLGVMSALVTAHKRAYAILKKSNPKAQIGIANPSQNFQPYDSSWLDALLTQGANTWYNFYFLDRIKDYQDFVGLNFYQTKTLDWALRQPPAKPRSDLGWQLDPEGVYPTLVSLQKRYGKPLYITENGLADASDGKREAYIKETLRSVHRAIADGADVRGYLHWSLLDNFEWAEGFWPRFGLIAVDRTTLARTVRPSAWAYAEIALHNSVPAQ